MFSTVVFDLDGTLLNTLDDLADAGNYTLATLGFPTHPVDAYKKMVGNGMEMLIKRISPASEQDPASLHLALSIFTEYYEKHQLDQTAPYPGIYSLLQQCKKAELKTAVLSNKDDLAVSTIVRHYFDDSFDEVWGLKPQFPPKPDPLSLLSLLDQLGATKENTLYCGDSNVDMRVAKKAGITSCGVLWGFRDRKELELAGADFLAASPQELATILFT